VKVATYNINGIRSRLPRLLDWLAREAPDIVCLQELKATDAAFPLDAIHAAGYGALWVGQDRVEWRGDIGPGTPSRCELARRCPGTAPIRTARYLEAAVDGMVVRVLVPAQRQSAAGPKFDYKLAGFDALITRAAALYSCGHPVVLAGDFKRHPHRFRHLQHALLAEGCANCNRRPASVTGGLLAQG
jgi:exodeoxyribonuclease-3